MSGLVISKRFNKKVFKGAARHNLFIKIFQSSLNVRSSYPKNFATQLVAGRFFLAKRNVFLDKRFQKDVWAQYQLLATSRFVQYKRNLNTQQKLFFFYAVKAKFPAYVHKLFLLLEMQLGSAITRAQLVPYLFMALDLCFYRLVFINNCAVSNIFSITSLFDSLSIPLFLFNYISLRVGRLQAYSKFIQIFFKKYWKNFTNYIQNKV